MQEQSEILTVTKKDFSVADSAATNAVHLQEPTRNFTNPANTPPLHTKADPADGSVSSSTTEFEIPTQGGSPDVPVSKKVLGKSSSFDSRLSALSQTQSEPAAAAAPIEVPGPSKLTDIELGLLYVQSLESRDISSIKALVHP